LAPRVECIVKSLVFLAGAQPILVLASDRTASTRTKWPNLSANRSPAPTPTSAPVDGLIGGVPRAGHTTELHTLVDASLLQHDEVRARGPTNAVLSQSIRTCWSRSRAGGPRT
jgi:prolyl-tRNA editing enzyme YbaK/EbsC (Cys-tRNA(Pro) deacylase)